MAPAPDHVDDEMHELNHEADYLDQKITVDHNGVRTNGTSQKRHSVVNGNNDADAQAQVIESLRTQIQDLFSQVSQLNGKLVHSYDRVSDLEDELHISSSNLRTATLKVSQLELERSQHLSALSTGLLVEKDHVTTELTRLMEKATEEAARAGEAESARVAIEKDLDDLSANLFDQANTMVAEARFARAQSERKVEETEQALKGAEEIVGVMQVQMQALQAEKEQALQKAEEMRVLMGKGKWVERGHAHGHAADMHFLNLHSPYAEYISFIAHLRTIRPATQTTPAMSTLLPQPFLARLIAEDSDPTIRLDLAPSLNWLTRRSVLSAIHSGQLNIEPMSTGTLLDELSTHTTSGLTQSSHISCALCGANIIENPLYVLHQSPLPSPTRNGTFSKPGWGSSFLKSSLQTMSHTPFSHSSTPPPGQMKDSDPPSQVYIFRLDSTASSGLPVPLPLGSQQNGTQSRTATIYPLCTSGWCLTRLRTTCSLWAFIRTSVVEKIWEDEPYLPPPAADSLSVSSDGIDRPSTPAKKARIGIGALWGTVSRSLSNGSAQEKPAAAESHKPKEVSTTDAKPPLRRLPPPPPPPRHPGHSATPPPPPPRRHPPPASTTATSEPSAIVAPVPIHPVGPPPPLPKRNRQRTESPAVPQEPSTEEKASVPASTEGSDATAAVLSPPEESHDEFKTPVEDLPGPPLDLVNAANVPLPPSAPATPTAAVPPPSNPPSRVASPALDATTAPVHPVPPPLPRRAAARARPSSMGLNPPITASPDEPTPERETEEVTDSKAEVEVDEATQEVKPEESSPSEPHKTVEDVKEEHETKEAVEEEESHADPEGETKDDEHAPPAYDEVPGSDLVEEKTQSPVQAVQAFPDEKPPSDLTEVADKADELDTSMYVGIATWEERTWRELMKLREDMFWARVGGVR